MEKNLKKILLLIILFIILQKCLRKKNNEGFVGPDAQERIKQINYILEKNVDILDFFGSSFKAHFNKIVNMVVNTSSRYTGDTCEAYQLLPDPKKTRYGKYSGNNDLVDIIKNKFCYEVKKKIYKKNGKTFDESNLNIVNDQLRKYAITVRNMLQTEDDNCKLSKGPNAVYNEFDNCACKPGYSIINGACLHRTALFNCSEDVIHGEKCSDCNGLSKENKYYGVCINKCDCQANVDISSYKDPTNIINSGELSGCPDQVVKINGVDVNCNECNGVKSDSEYHTMCVTNCTCR